MVVDSSRFGQGRGAAALCAGILLANAACQSRVAVRYDEEAPLQRAIDPGRAPIDVVVVLGGIEGSDDPEFEGFFRWTRRVLREERCSVVLLHGGYDSDDDPAHAAGGLWESVRDTLSARRITEPPATTGEIRFHVIGYCTGAVVGHFLVREFVRRGPPMPAGRCSSATVRAVFVEPASSVAPWNEWPTWLRWVFLSRHIGVLEGRTGYAITDPALRSAIEVGSSDYFPDEPLVVGKSTLLRDRGRGLEAADHFPFRTPNTGARHNARWLRDVRDAIVDGLRSGRTSVARTKEHATDRGGESS